MGCDVVEGAGSDPLHGLLGEVSLMAGDEDVVEGEQAGQLVVLEDIHGEVAVEDTCLGLVDVQPGAGQVLVLESVDEGFGVDEAATGGVDEDGPGGHELEGSCINNVIRLGAEGKVQGDDS